MCYGQNFACSGRLCACWHLRRQKFACLKIVLSFFENFLSFFGFSMVKIQFLQKVLKKWSSFRKKNKIFFHNRGGEGRVRTLYGIFHNLFYFFLNPSLTYKRHLFFLELKMKIEWNWVWTYIVACNDSSSRWVAWHNLWSKYECIPW